MPFTFLLWKCLREGCTTYRATGSNKSVSLRPISDESVSVYHTDCDEFKRQFSLEGKKVSDALFFAKLRATSPNLLFVEIKSDDYRHAIEQLTNVIQRIRAEVGTYTASYYAVVLLSRATVPKDDEAKRLARQLSAQRVTLKFGRLNPGGTFDLRSVL
jgi:chlorite dismutase